MFIHVVRTSSCTPTSFKEPFSAVSGNGIGTGLLDHVATCSSTASTHAGATKTMGKVTLHPHLNQNLRDPR